MTPQRIALARPPAPRKPSRIVLYGRLKHKFGPEFTLGVSSPAMAVYALNRMVPGFREEFARGAYRIVRGDRFGGETLSTDVLEFMLAGKELHIIPVAKGCAKGNAGGIAKIILGVAFIALAALTYGGAFAAGGVFSGLGAGGAAAGGFGATFLGVSAASWGFLGVGLVFSGVGQILTHVPKPPNPEASFILQPPSNTTAQGGPVPIIYGTLVRVGSTVISSGYEATALIGAVTVATDDYGVSPRSQYVSNGLLTGGTGFQQTGPVASVTVQQPGSGYTYCTVGFTSTNGGSGATATATISDGAITAITITAGGADYAAAPSVTLTGDGTGASAIANLNLDV